MTPRTGRPPVENPRDKRITICLTDEEYKMAEEAREKDRNQERALSTWIARKVSEMVNKLAKK